MGGTMIDYVSCSVAEMPYLDVFEYKPKAEKEDEC